MMGIDEVMKTFTKISEYKRNNHAGKYSDKFVKMPRFIYQFRQHLSDLFGFLRIIQIISNQ
jgi:hypothetical protein